MKVTQVLEDEHRRGRKVPLKSRFVVYRDGVAKLCLLARIPKRQIACFLSCCQMLPCGLALRITAQPSD
jgi:hypothetical protein